LQEAQLTGRNGEDDQHQDRDDKPDDEPFDEEHD